VSGLSRGRHVIPADGSLVCDDDWREVYALVTHGAVEVRTHRTAAGCASSWATGRNCMERVRIRRGTGERPRARSRT
jgi:hypothetical protein